MKVIYILFFLVLNLLIFSYLTGKIKINNSLKVASLVFISVTLVLHFLNYIKLSSDKLFFILFIFSLAPFVLTLLSKATVWFAIKANSNIKEHFVLNMFNFMMNYVFYGLISIFQIITLIKD